ncbi:hypothetical protein Desor_1905 [Desulfosporosinus orientis DSM 765]|uniref:Uncharacterized protein n=1 Tax=Desulfosporosinus orientis (strain ATCC 19365 / DSM 765 / NCIMB 8382 / VKM B-1628 / Singapore I) TaxID=768706 RepID=G7WB30_DESOD|nr:hypothetical protein Desor_1905 [Desulfosporosinus orientis DSM 765]
MNNFPISPFLKFQKINALYHTLIVQDVIKGTVAQIFLCKKYLFLSEIGVYTYMITIRYQRQYSFFKILYLKKIF